MEIPILKDVVIIFALSVFVILIFHKLKIPPIIGFLVTGIIIGPTGILSEYLNFRIISNQNHEINYLAEIGVILLLFTIGIEFSIKNLLKIRRIVLLGGGLQVSLSIVFTSIIATLFDYSIEESVFMGFLVALSSTAIVLRLTQEKDEMNTNHGKTTLGILIFQDIIIVPMILLTPILAGKASNLGTELIVMLIKAIGLIAFTIISSRWLIPKLLHIVAKTASQELFLLTLLSVGFAVAFLTSILGLSLALGAFLAGLAISESEYSHQAFGNILPFRDIFTAFFFVSVGMLLNVDFLVSEPWVVLVFAFFVLFIKTFVSGLVAFVLGFPFRTTVIVGLTLSQIGEFSFVLAEMGRKEGFLIGQGGDDYYYQLFLAVTTVTMILTPFIIMLAPKISELAESKLPVSPKMKKGLKAVKEQKPEGLNNHLIIVGMGLNGSNLAKAAKRTEIEYLVIESDADLVQKMQARGEPIIFGDASYENVLRHAEIVKAHTLVCVIDNPVATFSIIKTSRKLNPELHIIVRTRYVEDVPDLFNAGANEVVPEEFETSVEIFSRVLNHYLIPFDEINKLTAEIRSDGYGVLRDSSDSLDMEKTKISIPGNEINTVKIVKESSVRGKSLKEMDLRSKYGVTVVAISRSGKAISNPDPDLKFMEGDIVHILGSHKNCACILPLFVGKELPDCNYTPETF